MRLFPGPSLDAVFFYLRNSSFLLVKALIAARKISGCCTSVARLSAIVSVQDSKA
jgi:hypothetical protein